MLCADLIRGLWGPLCCDFRRPLVLWRRRPLYKWRPFNPAAGGAQVCNGVLGSEVHRAMPLVRASVVEAKLKAY